MNKQLRDRLRIPPNPLKLSEAQIQRAVFAELRLREREYPQLRYIIHVPNEGKRSAIGGKLAKDGGLQPGVPDIVSLVGKRWALELKANDNVPSPAQSWWMEKLESEGYAIGLAFSIDEAVSFAIDQTDMRSIYHPARAGWKPTLAYIRYGLWSTYLAESSAELIDPRYADSDKSRAW